MNVTRRGIGIALVLVVPIFFTACSIAGAVPPPSVSALPPVSRAASDILAKVAQAETLCARVTTYRTPLRATHGHVRIGGKLQLIHFIEDRPVILCGFRESDQSWHVVEVHVHIAIDGGERIFTYTPVTPGYTVEWLQGRGATRLIFDLADEHGEHLVTYRSKHVDVPQSAIDHELTGKRLLELSTAQTYTPYHPDFGNQLTDIGMRYLQGEIFAAQEELRRAGVASRAFPDRLLADVIPWEIPMALGAIEQMDDGKWLADGVGATESVYADYALNKEKAFRYSMSSAQAVGATQFTNRNGNGTYSLVVREYSDAGLDPRFPEGAENLRNALKAQICLLDMELAALSPRVKALYERKPLIGGIYPVAAYNGGHGWAVELGKTLDRSGVDLEGDDVSLPDRLIKKQSGTHQTEQGKKHTRISVTKKIENVQTAMYVQKYVSVINFLAERFDRENGNK